MQNYLIELLPDERTDVVFVGYQAKGHAWAGYSAVWAYF